MSWHLLALKQQLINTDFVMDQILCLDGVSFLGCKHLLSQGFIVHHSECEPIPGLLQPSNFKRCSQLQCTSC